MEYEEVTNAKYLSQKTEHLSIKERKLMFICRFEDIDVKENRKWQYEDMSCSSCKENMEDI